MQTDQQAIVLSGFDGVRQKGQKFFFDLAASFRVHLVFIILVAAYMVGLATVQVLADTSFVLRPFKSLYALALSIVPISLLGIVIIRFYHIAVHVKPVHPIPALLKDIGGFLSSPARLLNAIPMALALMFFIECFSFIKSAIPAVNPYSWDVTFMEFDRWLHFGVDPWRLLQPVFGYWWMTFFVNLVYNLWFVVIWVVWVALAFANRQSALRLQYLVAFFLSWSIGGSLLAIVFSSAGPVYFGRLGLGPDPFAPLLDYLRTVNNYVPIWAVTTQDMLWTSYENSNKGMVSGISAMPSMHNTSAILVAFLGWRVSRLAGIAGTAFAVTILIGSVHLGWHYAIDGYFGFLLAGFFWWGSGHFVRWYMALPMIARDLASLEEDQDKTSGAF